MQIQFYLKIVLYVSQDRQSAHALICRMVCWWGKEIGIFILARLVLQIQIVGFPIPRAPNSPRQVAVARHQKEMSLSTAGGGGCPHKQ